MSEEINGSPEDADGTVTQYLVLHISDEFDTGVKVLAQGGDYQTMRDWFQTHWDGMDEVKIVKSPFPIEQSACTTFPSLKDRHSAKLMQTKNRRNIEGCWSVEDRKSWYMIERITLSAEMVSRIREFEESSGLPGGGFIQADPTLNAPQIHAFELLSMILLLENLEWDFVRVKGLNPIDPEDFQEVESQKLNPLSFEFKGTLKQTNAIKHVSTVAYIGKGASRIGPEDAKRLASGVAQSLRHLSGRVNAQDTHIQARDEYIRKLLTALQEERDGKSLIEASGKDIALVNASKHKN